MEQVDGDKLSTGAIIVDFLLKGGGLVVAAGILWKVIDAVRTLTKLEGNVEYLSDHLKDGFDRNNEDHRRIVGSLETVTNRQVNVLDRLGKVEGKLEGNNK